MAHTPTPRPQRSLMTVLMPFIAAAFLVAFLVFSVLACSALIDDPSASDASTTSIAVVDTTQMTEIPPTTQPPVTTDEVEITTAPPRESDGHTEGELVTLEVAGWGETITNLRGDTTLKAIGQEPGDRDDTTQVNLELCANVDTVLPDTNEGWNGIDVIELPEDGVINANYDAPEYDETENELLYPPAEITVDNTHTVVVQATETYMNDWTTAGNLVTILPAGTCTAVQVQVYTADLPNLVFGYAYTTMPFGEWRPDGGFTRLQEGAAGTTFQSQWDVN